ncbi:MAG: TerC/Alx family metal homeostasis membrane protein [Mycobacterium sp.]|uniref:TerC/Alx family metal homeostasis membrane protein n=1 Tax=Mycobacterium sp. TaxID=1785 RepID=UPI003CC5085C
MEVSGLIWALTIAVIAGLALFDYAFHVRKAHRQTLRSAAIWSGIYIGAAIVFGLSVIVIAGTSSGIEYFAGYLINEALSVDNLFVLLVLVNSFAVPRAAQQKVLLFGVMFALIARTAFIFIGAALVAVFDAAFYVFSVILFITAGNLLKPSGSGEGSGDMVAVRIARRVVRTSDRYDGDRLFTVENGRRVMTPLLLAVIAVGGTDLLFAFDSIPAMFGLTRSVYLVFAATAFSLLTMRQLYFLLERLLDRLVYLSYGLATVLGLIGVKLMLQALHANNVPFINRGKPVPVTELSTSASLTLIVVILVLTTVVSLLSPAGRAHSAAAGARRHATAYLNRDHDVDPAEREEIFDRLLTEERRIAALPTNYRRRIQRQDLSDLLHRAHEARDADNSS